MKRPGHLVSALTAVLAMATALPALADDHRGGGRHDEGRRDGGFRGEGRHDGGHWNGRIEHFHERDFHTWHQGHWQHGFHSGRYGWWWLAGGLWYLYPTPIYPYPDPYAPPVVAGPQPAVPVEPPPPQYWYYCDAAGGYYPYVPTCASGWRAVPANPAP